MNIHQLEKFVETEVTFSSVTSRQISFCAYIQVLIVKMTIMKNGVWVILFLLLNFGDHLLAQALPDKEENDLIDTRLKVRLNFSAETLDGNELITIKPHAHATDSLSLDAKGLEIHKVEMKKTGGNIPLHYSYDGAVIHIRLDRLYKAGEPYIVHIDYTSKPDGSGAKSNPGPGGREGLYFINPRKEMKDKPVQVWTLGEPESNSAWFPTIDKPGQRTTEDISITVPAEYTTLSNGMLIDQQSHSDGTRTDHWKLGLPHAPYLFFIGVGEYAVVRDTYKGKEVSYYVEKEYASVARRIFGHTPAMMAYFSKITGVEYPWPKYAQIVVRDFTAKGMENTTATLQQESAQQDARELSDYNSWEDVISHELFHQWFGDLVTPKNWNNVCLSESFADYGMALWQEHANGKDAGDAVSYRSLQDYLANPANAKKQLVRDHYSDKMEMFDVVSYSKGACVLRMLRNMVGDSTFFAALHVYLQKHAFHSVEAGDLRRAFETSARQDLRWFWDQWFYGGGHPRLNISYAYDEGAGTARVIIRQVQDSNNLFRFPIAIDLYTGADKQRHQVWVSHQVDSFSFPCQKMPDLINVDADKVLLCEKKDNKTLANYIFAYRYAKNYVDRREALEYCTNRQTDSVAVAFLASALRDPSPGLRYYTLSRLDLRNPGEKKAVETTIFELAGQDSNRIVRAKAIELLGSYRDRKYQALFIRGLEDSSYSICGSSLEALAPLDSAAALATARKFATWAPRGRIMGSVLNVLARYGDESCFDLLSDYFDKMASSRIKFDFLKPYADILSKTRTTTELKKGVDIIVRYRNSILPAFHSQTDPYINNTILKEIAARKKAEGLQEQADYVQSKLPGE